MFVLLLTAKTTLHARRASKNSRFIPLSLGFDGEKVLDK